MLFADLALARRLEAAEAQKYLDYAAARGRMHPELTPAWEPIAGGYAVYAGDGNPYNRGIGLGCTVRSPRRGSRGWRRSTPAAASRPS